MKSESGIGDWLFVGGMMTLIGGYMAYENMDQVNSWLMSLQTPVQAQNTVSMATDTSLGAWIFANWGAVALMVAIIFVVTKWLLAQRGNATGGTAGPTVTYKRPRYINAKLVR